MRRVCIILCRKIRTDENFYHLRYDMIKFEEFKVLVKCQKKILFKYLLNDHKLTFLKIKEVEEGGSA